MSIHVEKVIDYHIQMRLRGGCTIAEVGTFQVWCCSLVWLWRYTKINSEAAVDNCRHIGHHSPLLL